MADQLERLRALARLDVLPEVALLLETLTAGELERLERLLRDWPPSGRAAAAVGGAGLLGPAGWGGGR
jgi:hypothetical protein